MRFFLLLSYCGARYGGWQIQKNSDSVQAEVERALSIVLKEKISVTGAGRTDAGVNASYYVLHFDTLSPEAENISANIYKINAILPNDIAVFDVCQVPDGAHARFDAESRTYKYFLHTVKDPFAERSLYWPYHLDFERMNRAATLLIGKRDFSCFEKTHSGSATPICKIAAACWSPLSEEGHHVFTITSDRFLRNMVRAIVGTLLEVGKGRREPEWIEDVLKSNDRSVAGQSVPGEPLFLAGITYPYPLFGEREQKQQ
ncbi:MAG: tRNA pseudouridine(38-40) synthase TruA [Bacteroidales bacterium]|jgi:tRNA pseudouridine38-40 synthase|nr:tRNA pseudouridine(38-40) synthase TruA [Bacteroidales bacterium]MCI2121578.1 tRNA pseudouridine(38-40) synthase TruA [Bacteroidales bacterium]MCI2145704.1 tRNA pseudouridine(38-40) synthase TruA [Bacteroidales bacterium]